jgi:hypothetical protein
MLRLSATFSKAIVLQNIRALIYEVHDFREKIKSARFIEPLTLSTLCINKRITFRLSIDIQARYITGTCSLDT